jgi:glycosyltransferase involved in cell wall biosynthesis
VLVAPGDVPALRDGLRRVLTDAAARERYRERAVAAATEFSTERIGERYRAVLRAAAGR